MGFSFDVAGAAICGLSPAAGFEVRPKEEPG
jgi:hypothetical protein